MPATCIYTSPVSLAVSMFPKVYQSISPFSSGDFGDGSHHNKPTVLIEGRVYIRLTYCEVSEAIVARAHSGDRRKAADARISAS